MINKVLKYGNCELSCLAYTAYAFLAGEMTGNYLQAFELGNIGVQLAERTGNTQLVARCNFYYGVGSVVWNRHLSQAAEMLEKAFNIL